MTFKDAVRGTAGLEKAWRSGLGAIASVDRQRIIVEGTLQLRGSVDVDGALKDAKIRSPG
ncbi:MAG TPA: hypothetical protein VMV69_02170 [Pirellulales bacterium]|nr:hypothetical protein [Pirellulales bacterium]